MAFFIFKELWEGKSLLRILMNQKAKDYTIAGKTIDIGGGINPEYHHLLKKSTDTRIETVDLKDPGPHGKRLDLEADTLPFNDNSVESVLLFNILEHIYHHQFVVQQAFRILKPEGIILGFVPFLINYHPDPHDYFRYTREALFKIFTEAGFTTVTIEEIGGGPFFVNFNTIVLSLPKIVRISIWPVYYGLDTLFLKLRPQVRRRYPLGYFFQVKK